mgnify:CR=1 FL=1
MFTDRVIRAAPFCRLDESLKVLNISRQKLKPILDNISSFSISFKQVIQSFSARLNSSIVRCKELIDLHQRLFKLLSATVVFGSRPKRLRILGGADAD